MPTIIAAVATVVVLVAVAVGVAEARVCQTNCTPTYGGGMSCTQSCF